MKNKETPKRGFAGLKAHFKDDLISGFSVSLIALPLCLGIAIASGVPPLAGLITAIVGGILASRISGSFVTISGPAAGLIVISLGAAESMGGAGADHGFAGYPHALGAILIGGLIMAVFGLLKVGKVGDYFPTAAVHGMLAAIGVIIIIKQIFPAIGFKPEKGEILEVATQIPHALTQINPYAGGIALVSLIILIVHPMLKIKSIKMVPAPMWVLIATIPMAAGLGIENLKMVEMPHNLLGEGGIQFPSFEKIGESAFWIAVTGVALVSAIESLLSAKAVDSLDPYKRKTNLDKDLISMGVGSSLAAAIGGLPMISEIVRSSANVNNGAKTQWANFFHGTFLLIFLLVGVFVIEMIPISALAAMLVFTGFKLASPKEFKNMYKIGLMEFEIFVVTLVAVLATDLIIGIVIGILFKYVILIVKGTKFNELFKSHSTILTNGDTTTLQLTGSQIFSNYLSLKKQMDLALKIHKSLNLDFSNVSLVDHTVMDHLEDYERNAKLQGLEVHMVNIDALNPVSDHPLAARDKKMRLALDDVQLSPRTISLLSFSNKNRYQFQNRTEDYVNWEFYTLTIRKKIISISNIVTKNSGSVHFEVADIKTQEGAQLSSDTNEITALKISGLTNLPKFYMLKESFIDKITSVVSSTDINFEAHPKFSKNYLLKGIEEDHVRSFFTPKLLSFFENNLNYFMVSNGNDLLVYSDSKLLDTTSIQLLLDKAESINEILAGVTV